MVVVVLLVVVLLLLVLLLVLVPLLLTSRRVQLSGADSEGVLGGAALLKHQLCAVRTVYSSGAIEVRRLTDGRDFEGFAPEQLAEPSSGGTLLHLALELQLPHALLQELLSFGTPAARLKALSVQDGRGRLPLHVALEQVRLLLLLPLLLLMGPLLPLLTCVCRGLRWTACRACCGCCGGRRRWRRECRPPAGIRFCSCLRSLYI